MRNEDDFANWCERKGFVNPEEVSGITPFKYMGTIHPDDKKYLIVCGGMFLITLTILLVSQLCK